MPATETFETGKANTLQIKIWMQLQSFNVELMDWGKKTFWQSTDPAKYSGNLKPPSSPTKIREGRFEGKNMPTLKYSSVYMLSHLLIVFTNNNPFQI